MLNLRYGVSSFYVSGSEYKTKIPPLEGSYEKMISDKFSVGGFIGIFKTEYFVSNEYYELSSSYNYLNIGAMGDYHFVNTDEFNAYVGGKLGYVKLKTKTEMI